MPKLRPFWLLLPLVCGTVGLYGAQAQEPRRCIGLTSIDRTEVIDEQTIAFFMAGGDIYLNRLDRACPNLGRDRPFSYRTTVGQLCSVDVITVIEDFGGGLNRGASCGLGEFNPVAEEDLELLRGEREPATVSVEEIPVEEIPVDEVPVDE